MYISFYDFAKQYVTIKDNKGNEHKFSEHQLEKIKEMEEMINKGYELKFIHLRKGTKLRWVKNYTVDNVQRLLENDFNV